MNSRGWQHIVMGLICFGVVPMQLVAGPASPSALYRSDRILVQPRRGQALTPLSRFHSTQKAGIRRAFPRMANLQVIEVPRGADIPLLIQRYERSGLVEFAEPDYLMRATVAGPNDPKYLNGTLWGLHNTGQSRGLVDADIDAPEAWEIRTSASNVVVAVLDTGVRATHEDLADNMWVHPVDGGHGWNALSGTNNPADDNGHGTLVSGVLGAVGDNGKGVTGVAWSVQIMALKCLDSSGNGSASDVITCIDYARTHGAHIINTSLDSDMFSAALSNAIVSARDAGILFVASAGNNGSDIDVFPRYPSCYDIDNIVSVAASTRTDELWGSSNFGVTNVDLAAPGHQIHSTFFINDSFYLGPLNGTSLAAPYVTGTLALLLAKYPWETYPRHIERLLAGVDPVPALTGKCMTGGRLNLRNALSPPVVLTVLSSTPGGPFELRVSGGRDQVFVILTTSDFLSWTPVEINTTGPSGFYDYVDADSGHISTRFYRVIAQP